MDRDSRGREHQRPNYIPYRFTAKEWDSETGLYSFPARYFEPKLSRWMSADPAGFGLMNPMEEDEEGKLKPRQGYSMIESTNWYSYTSNNPIKYIDPTGESATIVGAILGTAGGAAKGIFRELTDNRKGVSMGRVITMAAIGMAKGTAVGLVVDATVAGAAATVASGGTAAPIAAAGVIALGTGAASAVGFVTGTLGSAAEQKMYDGKVDMNTALKDGGVDALFAAGGTVLAGTGKVAKETSVTYSRYARNAGRGSWWSHAADRAQNTGKALSVSSDLATATGSFYGTANKIIDNE